MLHEQFKPYIHLKYSIPDHNFHDNEERLNSVQLLLNLSADFECAGTFKNGNNLRNDIESSQPDLILMDIDMAAVNGIEATKLIRI